MIEFVSSDVERVRRSCCKRFDASFDFVVISWPHSRLPDVRLPSSLVERQGCVGALTWSLFSNQQLIHSAYFDPAQGYLSIQHPRISSQIQDLPFLLQSRQTNESDQFDQLSSPSATSAQPSSHESLISIVAYSTQMYTVLDSKGNERKRHHGATKFRKLLLSDSIFSKPRLSAQERRADQVH